MEWLKLSAKFTRDPKIVGLSARARWTYLHSLCEIADHESDGLYRPGGKPTAAMREIIDAGLWEFVSPGLYRVPVWTKWNPTKAQLDARRNASSNAARKRWAFPREPDPHSEIDAEVERELDVEEPTTKADLRSVPANPFQPTHDQLYLAGLLAEALTPAVIVKLNKRFGVSEVSDVLRSLHGFGGDAEDWVAYVTGILNARREAM